MEIKWCSGRTYTNVSSILYQVMDMYATSLGIGLLNYNYIFWCFPCTFFQKTQTTFLTNGDLIQSLTAQI